MKNKLLREVPVFFAADENYMPFLGITLSSLIEHADKNRTYQVHVLYTGTLGANAEMIESMQTENVRVSFFDVSKQVKEIEETIRCRDYYTSAIYFRLFIPSLFPQYERAVYLDCDTVLLTDVGKLYDMPLGENYVGAVADAVVSATPQFSAYAKRALGIEARKYFNSGVIVMHLERLRAIDFCRLFTRVLRSYDFVVAPDQDCLNLICKDKVKYFGAEWNAMPLSGEKLPAPKIIHYNLAMKPWHYDGILYGEYFWETAKRTPFYQTVLERKERFTAADAKRDKESGERLLSFALAEAENPRNYERTVGERVRRYRKTQKVGGMYGLIEYFSEKKSVIRTN